MPLTAPTNVTFKRLSMALIDGSGDRRSVSIRVSNTATTTQLLGVAAALGAASQANLFQVEIQDVYADNPDADDALDFERDSVYDNVIILFRNISTGASQSVPLPAPMPAVMVDETDTPNTDSELYETYRDAVDDALGDGWDAISTRYTERREINDRRFPA